MSIVIEVKDFKIDQVNGQRFERYKLKLLDNGRVLVTDGFKPVSKEQIKPYDVIENMVIIRTLDPNEQCEAYYRAQEIEKRNLKHLEIAKAEAIKDKTWVPAFFGQSITVDNITGTFSSMSLTYPYLKAYTYFLTSSEGKIIHEFTGKKEGISGEYIDMELLPGYEGKIDKWFPYKLNACLRYIKYKNGKYEYRFTGEDYMPQIFFSERLVGDIAINTIKQDNKKANETIKAKSNKAIMNGQQDLFSMLSI